MKEDFPPSHTPEDAMQEVLVRDILIAALNQLLPEERQAILQTFGDIGNIDFEEKKHHYVVLSRGMRKLKKYFTDHNINPGDVL